MVYVAFVKLANSCVSVGKNYIFILTLFQAMVAHGRVELLAHPLSQKYLQMKWNSYGKYFHLANLLVYIVFLAFVTLFSSQLMDFGDAFGENLNSTQKLNKVREKGSVDSKTNN